MYSPFYTSELNRLYPNRKYCANGREVIEHMRHLVNDNIISFESLSNKKLGTLKHEYFINASVDQILNAFNEIRENN